MKSLEYQLKQIIFPWLLGVIVLPPNEKKLKLDKFEKEITALAGKIEEGK